MAETFTSKIREAIENYPHSRYVLAREVEVSEATLSRFISGKRGLSLSNLDKLAEALGLEIRTTVQKLPDRRPRKGGKKDASGYAGEWSKLAAACAKDAHENNFASRRGTYVIDGVPTSSGQALCMYNNNPYAEFPELRDQETRLFRDQMEQLNIRELAYATYHDGYTYAMILDAGGEQQAIVADVMKAILNRDLERRISSSDRAVVE